MGEYADMILDGTLDEMTGEYAGDHNLEQFGTESPGFPVTLSDKEHKPKVRKPKPKMVQCPECQKWVKQAGLKMHTDAVHSDTLK